MNRAKKEIAFYSIYTIIFAGILWGVFHYFPENDKILINHADAFRQHLRALAYYSKWLRGVFYNIFVQHDLSLQTFSFGMG